MMEYYSLSDIRAATGSDGMNGGFGNDLFLVILFLFFFGNGNGFGNRNGFGDAATAAAQNEILSGQQFDRVGQKLDGISQGLCNGFYSTMESMKDCCCQTQLMGKDIAASVHAEGEATRALIQQNEMQTLRDRVTDLQMGLSQCRQNEYLVGKLTPPCPVPAYITCSPYQSYNPCGCGNFGGGYQPSI